MKSVNIGISKKVMIEILLFLKPQDEFSEKDLADPTKFRRGVVDLCKHLTVVADAVEKLHKAGWSIGLGVYELSCYPDKDYTEAEARKLLRRLGIKPSLANFHELDDEEDEDFDEDVEEVVRTGGKR